MVKFDPWLYHIFFPCWWFPDLIILIVKVSILTLSTCNRGSYHPEHGLGSSLLINHYVHLLFILYFYLMTTVEPINLFFGTTNFVKLF